MDSRCDAWRWKKREREIEIYILKYGNLSRVENSQQSPDGQCVRCLEKTEGGKEGEREDSYSQGCSNSRAGWQNVPETRVRLTMWLIQSSLKNLHWKKDFGLHSTDNERICHRSSGRHPSPTQLLAHFTLLLTSPIAFLKAQCTSSDLKSRFQKKELERVKDRERKGTYTHRKREREIREYYRLFYLISDVRNSDCHHARS